MAGLHEARKGPRMQEDDALASAPCLIPQCYIYAANLRGVSGSRVDTEIPTEDLEDRFPEWFEVSLLRNEDLPSDVHHSHIFTKSTNLRKTLDVSAKTVTAEYLNLLWSDFHGSLKFSVYDFKYNLFMTVPDIWPICARYKMRQAIRKADILSDKFDMIPKSIP
ncbi:mitochondrial-type heat shock 70 [Fusarium sporotrichioides]|uniref:Mitochondrial-type heat shock 70 n=1 Tax=Fusarium sporotrichioides TaxID=5514 RepID=A0A395S982_FUSSP|nr:mitochondrial-type heat shock 70 [Fusarium sporotrichioides]